MKTFEKKKFALAFLILFMLSLYPGEVRADSGTTERPGQRSFRIVGGEIVNPPNAYPWTAQIGYHRPPPNARVFTVWCGGALIDRSWVLSAAHCFDDTVGSRYVLTLGEHTLNQADGTEQIIQVQEIIVHPDYNPSTSDNDIALLRLANPATLNTHVNTIELGDLPNIGTPLTVVGWGATTQGGAISNQLLETAVPLRSDNDCRNAYPGEITNAMFCAGFDGGGTDSCQGDSGGPIFFNEGGTSRQIGVVSWGRGCAQANFFGVYTHVAGFTEWLNTEMGGGVIPIGPGVPEAGSNIIPVSPPPTKGSISEAGMENSFQFTVASQGSFTIETNGTSNGMDTVISLFESTNQTTPLAQNDDLIPGNVNSRITTTLSPGTYVIKVSHYHSNQVGTYTIFVQANDE